MKPESVNFVIHGQQYTCYIITCMLLYEFLPALETKKKVCNSFTKKKKVCNCGAIYDILLYMLLYKLLPSLEHQQWASQMPNCKFHLAFGPKLLQQLDGYTWDRPNFFGIALRCDLICEIAL